MPEDPASPRVARLAIQANHGFSRANVIRFDGTSWVKGLAGDAGLGIAGSVLDANTFEFIQLGYLDGLDGLNFLPGVTYYAHAGTPGELTTSATSSPLFLADSASSGYVMPASAAATSTGAAGGATSGDLATAIATEVARANATYAPLSHSHDSEYVSYDDAVVDIDTGTVVFDVDTLEQVVNLDS